MTDTTRAPKPIARPGGKLLAPKPAPRPVSKPAAKPMTKPMTKPVVTAGHKSLPTAPRLADLPAAHLPKLGNRFVAVKVSVAIPSNARTSRKIIERNAQHGGANTNAAKASVVLFDPAHLEPLRTIKSNLLGMLNDIGLKTADGHYVIHASRSKTLIEMGTAAKQAYEEEARKFVDGYEDYCEQWAGNLGDDYDPRLYPALDKIARQIGVNTTGEVSSRKSGFVFSMNMISDHDEGLEHDMGLSLTDDEREFIAQGARAHYQGIVDQAFDQLRDAMAKIVEGDQPGRRVRKSTVEAANSIARKITAMGIDQNGVAAKAKELTSAPAPVRQSREATKRTNADVARDSYTSRAKSILADLENLTSDQSGE